MQLALNSAVTTAGALVAAVPFCIVSLASGPPYPMAMTSNAGSENYAASLMKVAAMYTLFELRRTLRALATEMGVKVKAADFMKRADAYLSPQYYQWAKKTAVMANIAFKHATPKLADAFTFTDGASGVTVDFATSLTAPITYDAKQTATGGGYLGMMIYWSQTNGSFHCIRAAGYGTINGMLESAGLFDRGAQQGIWLAGDYEEAPYASGNKYPAYRIPSVNDGPSAQATTVVQMARLFALCFKGDLFGDAAASAEMLAYLGGDSSLRPAGYATHPNETWMDRSPTISDGPRNFGVRYGKLGVGPGNNKGDLYSETSILQHRSSRKQFIFAWANFLPDPKATDETYFLPVIQVAHQTIAACAGGP